MKLGYGTRKEYYHNDDKVYGEVIAEPKTIKEADSIIDDIIKDMGFESYYKQINYSVENDFVDIDFGSWSRFFFLWSLSDDDWKDLLGGNENS